LLVQGWSPLLRRTSVSCCSALRPCLGLGLGLRLGLGLGIGLGLGLGSTLGFGLLDGIGGVQAATGKHPRVHPPSLPLGRTQPEL